MCAPKAPAAPSPTETAQAQTDSNIQTALAQARLNAVNQVTPYYKMTYSTDGGAQPFNPISMANDSAWGRDPSVTPRPGGTVGDVAFSGGGGSNIPQYTATTELTSEGQRLFDMQKGIQDRLVGMTESPFTLKGLDLPAMRTDIGGSGDYSADRRRVEDALFGRLNDQLGKDRAAKETDLINRGIRPGSDAYSDTWRDFERTVGDNRTSALLAGGQEQSRLQQMDINAGNFTNTARSNAIAEALMARNQGFNENMSLLTGSQLPSPQFAPTPQTGVAGTDIAGITQNDYNSRLSAWNAQQQQSNSLMGGLFGLGANALMAFSDKRLKTNIKSTGEKVAGVPVKSWEWKGSGEKDTGVIAQDVEKKHPALVDKSHPSGYRRVDYGGLMRLGTSSVQEAA